MNWIKYVIWFNQGLNSQRIYSVQMNYADNVITYFHFVNRKYQNIKKIQLFLDEIVLEMKINVKTFQPRYSILLTFNLIQFSFSLVNSTLVLFQLHKNDLSKLDFYLKLAVSNKRKLDSLSIRSWFMETWLMEMFQTKTINFFCVHPVFLDSIASIFKSYQY